MSDSPADRQQWPPPESPSGGYGMPPAGYGTNLPATNEDRTWGLFAHLSGLVAAFVALGVLGPLVVLLVQGSKSPFVRRHAVEALNFQLTLLIATIAAVVASVATLGVALVVVLPLAVVIGIAALVLIIKASIAANNGEDYRYPLNWRLVS